MERGYCARASRPSEAPGGARCRTATPDTLQRRFLQTGGVIHTTNDTITVRLDRRAYSPVLRGADLPDTTIPWWGDRRLHLEYAEK